MMTATQCPTAEQWRSFSTGRLPENENDLLFEHLRDCSACQAELETIDDAEDSLISDLRSEDEQSGLLDEPECKRALAKALGALAATDEWSAIGIENLPRTIGEYEIVRLLGRGGMGNVFLARHNKLGRQVALKFLSAHRLADRRMRERFDAEMRAVGRLSHPNIVTAHDAREVDGTAVLVTEFIDGFDLGDLVARIGPLSVANASEVIAKVAAALQYTSDQGFVHRDVKPSNIMISRSGEVKLLDLGLARYQSGQEHELTGTGQAIGTADYVSPEQVTDGREVDCRSDLYSLGCTFFKLLTGNAPFADANHASVFAKMTAQVSEPPPSLIDRLPDAPAALVRLVDSMLAKEPAKRPQSGGEVVSRLAAWTSGHDLQALVQSANESEAQTRPLPQTSIIRSQPWHRRTVSIRKAIAAGLLGSLSCGLLGLVMGLYIKVTYPDGTVVQFPISGAQVEVLEQDAVADATANAAVDAAVDAAADVSAATPAITPVPSSSANDPRQLAQRMAQAGQASELNRLGGLWTFERIDSSNPAGASTGVVAFEGTNFISVTVRDGFGHFSSGVIESMQRDQNGSWMVLRESKNGNKMQVNFQFPDDQSAIFAFEPFSDLKSGPLPGVASFIDKNYTVILKRRGPMPVTNEQMLRLVNEGFSGSTAAKNSLQAIGMLMQFNSMDSDRIETVNTSMRDAAHRAKSRNHLKMIALAFHNFHDTFNQLPGSSSDRQQGARSANNKNIQPFSWRVAILPFIEQSALYERYRFDEPWDSEHNAKLIDEMPEIYRSPRAPEDQPKGHTNYLGYATGSSALTTEGESAISFKDVLDGTSNTMLVVETKNSVPWTKPEDLNAESQPEFFEPMIYAVLDGSVREEPRLDPESLKKMITRNGGEVIQH